ncbi:MarR family winged helix-turn-helix transcriptional regulator [Nonomuraea sp. NPDC002799]
MVDQLPTTLDDTPSDQDGLDRGGVGVQHDGADRVVSRRAVQGVVPDLGGISNVLQRLESAGYVEREANPGDARSRWVQLTGEGLRLAGVAVQASGRAYAEVAAGVPEESLRAAADSLREVMSHMGRRRFR